MSSRQSVAQRNSCRRSTCAGYERNIAHHVLTSTIQDERIGQPVMRCVAKQDATLAVVEVHTGQVFYLVSFVDQTQHLFYVVAKTNGQYICSVKDEVVRNKIIKQAKAYRATLLQNNAKLAA